MVYFHPALALTSAKGIGQLTPTPLTASNTSNGHGIGPLRIHGVPGSTTSAPIFFR
jgi:hypothetical protein